MKFLVLCFLALSYVAMAQNIVGGPGDSKPFHGVSIGGTVEQPTLANHGDWTAIGYAVERLTDNGVNSFFMRLSLESIVQNSPLRPGQERPISGMLLGNIGSRMVNGFITQEGKPLRYELRAILFDNGTFVGPDFVDPNDSKTTIPMQSVFDEFASRMKVMRTYARTMQGQPDKYAALEGDVAELRKITMPRSASLARSVDFSKLGDASDVAAIVLTVKAQAGEAEADKALDRIARLPELVRGE